MNMRSWTRALLLALLFLGAARLFAHDEFRFIGTVARMEGAQLQVKTGDGDTIPMKVNSSTYIHRDKDEAKLPVTELKAGISVVVDALGDDLTDLLALEVRIVPPIAPAKPK
jgi:hypothetical protein